VRTVRDTRGGADARGIRGASSAPDGRPRERAAAEQEVDPRGRRALVAPRVCFDDDGSAVYTAAAYSRGEKRERRCVVNTL